MIDIIIVVWLHFFSDFILQTDKVAKNKSSSNSILLSHCTLYSIPMLWFGLEFAVLNGVAHFIVDYFTSRATKQLYKDGETHWFFVVIGFDQAVHLTTLILTLEWLT